MAQTRSANASSIPVEPCHTKESFATRDALWHRTQQALRSATDGWSVASQQRAPVHDNSDVYMRRLPHASKEQGPALPLDTRDPLPTSQFYAAPSARSTQAHRQQDHSDVIPQWARAHAEEADYYGLFMKLARSDTPGSPAAAMGLFVDERAQLLLQLLGEGAFQSLSPVHRHAIDVASASIGALRYRVDTEPEIAHAARDAYARRLSTSLRIVPAWDADTRIAETDHVMAVATMSRDALLALHRDVCEAYARLMHPRERISLPALALDGTFHAMCMRLASDPFVLCGAYFDPARVIERKVLHMDAARYALDACVRSRITIHYEPTNAHSTEMVAGSVTPIAGADVIHRPVRIGASTTGCADPSPGGSGPTAAFGGEVLSTSLKPAQNPNRQHRARRVRLRSRGGSSAKPGARTPRRGSSSSSSSGSSSSRQHSRYSSRSMSSSSNSSNGTSGTLSSHDVTSDEEEEEEEEEKDESKIQDVGARGAGHGGVDTNFSTKGRSHGHVRDGPTSRFQEQTASHPRPRGSSPLAAHESSAPPLMADNIRTSEIPVAQTDYASRVDYTSHRKDDVKTISARDPGPPFALPITARGNDTDSEPSVNVSAPRADLQTKNENDMPWRREDTCAPSCAPAARSRQQRPVCLGPGDARAPYTVAHSVDPRLRVPVSARARTGRMQEQIGARILNIREELVRSNPPDGIHHREPSLHAEQYMGSGREPPNPTESLISRDTLHAPLTRNKGSATNSHDGGDNLAQPTEWNWPEAPGVHAARDVLSPRAEPMPPDDAQRERGGTVLADPSRRGGWPRDAQNASANEQDDNTLYAGTSDAGAQQGDDAWRVALEQMWDIEQHDERKFADLRNSGNSNVNVINTRATKRGAFHHREAAPLHERKNEAKPSVEVKHSNESQRDTHELGEISRHGQPSASAGREAYQTPRRDMHALDPLSRSSRDAIPTASRHVPHERDALGWFASETCGAPPSPIERDSRVRAASKDARFVARDMAHDRESCTRASQLLSHSHGRASAGAEDKPHGSTNTYPASTRRAKAHDSSGGVLDDDGEIMEEWWTQHSNRLGKDEM